MKKTFSKSLQKYLKSISSGEVLNTDESQDAFNIIVSGQASPIQVSGFLMGLASRGETVGELIGAVKAMKEKSVLIDAPSNAIDCCGTGGDHSGSLNISTAVSFVVAGCGVAVAKHGNRSSSSKSGAADVLEALGVNLDASADIMSKVLFDHNICFMMATKHHPAAKYVAPIRAELGTRTTFNLLGPLLNPANTKRQLIGVFDKKWCRPFAETLREIGSEFAWIVHGSDGLDEITTTGTTYVTELSRGKIQSFEIHPKDVDIDVASLDDIKGDDAAFNANALRDLLTGKKNAYRDIVLLNAAASLLVSGRVNNLNDGIKLSRQSIDNKDALSKLKILIEITND